MRTRAQAQADRRSLWREIERQHRADAKAKIASLREQSRAARQRRKHALRDAKERCRAERLAARERARALRLRVMEDLKAAVQAERQAARQSCSIRVGEARAIKDEIHRTRAELMAEKKYQRDLRRIEAANRQRRREAPRITRIERAGESDDEVVANLPADLVPLFQRVRRGIKATPRMTRTEAFLKWAEDHPSEVLTALDDKTDALIRELEQREREAARSLRIGPPKRARYTAAQLAKVPF